jgi:hypothetical protein
LQVNVTLAAVKPGMEATLASGGAVHEIPGGTVANGVQFVLDHLAVADALILRHKSDEDEQSFAYQNKQEPCTF